jgi:2-succinyl-5-enolpyruvyl-6-hydroxy-3-cyclohexene-1-carboxylate synthase
MKYPKNKLAQSVIASCVAQGIEHVVISPGSRNAPLTIGFTHYPGVKTYSIVDERCAAFVALGIAQQTKNPVVVLCTSGSALLNYYPAVAEAYYSDIPLVIISADRPAHLIDIGDGQTIRQKNVFESHSLCNANLEENKLHENKELLETAIRISLDQKGPVHINVPFDEPLYDTVPAMLEIPKVKQTISQDTLEEETPLDVDFLQSYADRWNQAEKKMVLVGSHDPDTLLQTQLEHFLKDPSVLVFTETISNNRHAKYINQIDQLIIPLEEENLKSFQPEILLTIGGMVVSKKIKQFLRKYQPKSHWHVDSKKAWDSYHCLTKHFKVSPQLFLSQFFFLTKNKDSNYQEQGIQLKETRQQLHAHFLETVAFSDLKVFDIILQSIPKDCNLQLSNSSIVRYSQFFEISPDIRVFCNRGTSGIDGSTSTAIGAAMTTKEPTFFITGDVSFFYDSNALWNQYIPSSFRIILINNDGGGIFKIIPGPKNSGALDYFETPHGLEGSHLCALHDLEYECAETEDELQNALQSFYKESSVPKLLEIKTPSEINDLVLQDYLKKLK